MVLSCVQIKLNPIDVGTDTFLTVVRLPYSQTMKFSGCSPEQAPSAQHICDTGATAFDAADGNLTNHVTVSPSSIPLNKPPGTRMKMVYSVSDYGTPRLYVEVERIIEIISPCASGERFCSGVCSKIACDQANAIAKVLEAETLDSRPPTLHLVDSWVAHIQTTYSKAALLPLLRGCESANFANAGVAMAGNMTSTLANISSKQLACGVYALTAEGSLITGVQAAVTQSYCLASSQCPTCSVASFEAGLCLPGVHIISFSVSTAAGVPAVLVHRVVRVAEAAQVKISVQIPYSGTLQQAQDFALSITGNVDLVRGIISTAESEVRSSVKARYHANSVSDLVGQLDSVTANQTADDAAPVVIISASVSFSYVPGLDIYMQITPSVESTASQSGPASPSQSSSLARRLLMDEPFGTEAMQSAGLWTPENSLASRRLQQGGAVSGLEDLLVGVQTRSCVI
jgi:hypothetical protein